MMIQSDSFSRNLELFRDLSTSMLSGSEAYAAWQFDSLLESVARGIQQLRTPLAEVSSVQEASQWPETIQNSMRFAIKVSRDNLIAASDYQMESLRLLQGLGNEIRQRMTDAMNEQLVAIDVVASREKRQGKGHSLAAQKIPA